MNTVRRTIRDLERADEITINVICQNKLHKVTLRKKGAVTLHNHEYRGEIKMAKMCKALNSDIPKCVRMLQYWQGPHRVAYAVNTPDSTGYGRMPPEVRNYRIVAVRERARIIAHRRNRDLIKVDNTKDERRFEWLAHIVFGQLAMMGCRVREFTPNKFRVADRGTSYGRKTTETYNVDHWLFRISASGMTNIIPKRFPLGIIEKDGHEWLHVVDKDLNVERVDISNGNRPETVTGSESEAKFEEAIRKYRLMESTSRRDKSNPYNGC